MKYDMNESVSVTTLTDAGGVKTLEGVIVGRTHIVPARYDIRVNKTGEIRRDIPEGQLGNVKKGRKDNVVSMR